MSYRMVEVARRLMCDKFSVLCTIAELNAKQLREETEEDDRVSKSSDALKRFLTDMDLSSPKLDDDYSLRLAEVRQLLFPPLKVKIKRLNENAVMPKYAHEGDSGVDLVATEDVIIEPGETKLVPTGLSFEIPPGFEIQVRPRSGVTLKTKLRVQLGTVDRGYRGEVGVIVDNISQEGHEYDYVIKTIDGSAYEVDQGRDCNSYIICKGDRIAQAIIAPVETAHFVDVEKLEETIRGVHGFGSTGVNEVKEAE